MKWYVEISPVEERWFDSGRGWDIVRLYSGGDRVWLGREFGEVVEFERSLDALEWIRENRVDMVGGWKWEPVSEKELKMLRPVDFNCFDGWARLDGAQVRWKEILWDIILTQDLKAQIQEGGVRYDIVWWEVQMSWARFRIAVQVNHAVWEVMEIDDLMRSFDDFDSFSMFIYLSW